MSGFTVSAETYKGANSSHMIYCIYSKKVLEINIFGNFQNFIHIPKFHFQTLNLVQNFVIVSLELMLKYVEVFEED